VTIALGALVLLFFALAMSRDDAPPWPINILMVAMVALNVAAGIAQIRGRRAEAASKTESSRRYEEER
jgi:hypothetical protein